MRSIVLSLAALFAAASLSAAPADLAQLESYASKGMQRCPNGRFTVDPILQNPPAGFQLYRVSQTSSDEHCRAQQYLLYSPASEQTVLGRIIYLAPDGRSIETRVAEYASQIVKAPVVVKFVPIGLPDGLRQVMITKETPYGPFSYQGFVDSSEKFLIIGMRGNLKEDPKKTLVAALNIDSGVRRGNAASKVDIVEISDFQCPTCARAHEKLEPLFAKNLKKIRYTRLDLPLFEHHDWAIFAALGARAIQRVAPASYWTYVDQVFKNQEKISKADFDNFLKNFASDHDLDWAAIERVYRSKSERQAVLDQGSRLFAVGIVSTPTFLVNGQIVGFGDGTFAYQAIEQAINGRF